jgi:hypothetical protein
MGVPASWNPGGTTVTDEMVNAEPPGVMQVKSKKTARKQ